MKEKTYYTLAGNPTRRVFIKASSKSAAAKASGVAADMWVPSSDQELINAATNEAQIEVSRGVYEPYTK